MDGFASLSLARAYVDTVRGGIGRIGPCELIEVLERLDRAYGEFPELVLERSREEILKGLHSAAMERPDAAAFPLLIYCLKLAPSCSRAVRLLVDRIARSETQAALPAALNELGRCRGVGWHVIKPSIEALRQQGREDLAICLFSHLLDAISFRGDEDVLDFEGVLRLLLGAESPPSSDHAALAEAVWSARRRLWQAGLPRSEHGSRDHALATAGRLAAVLAPLCANPHPDFAWPSGRLSFDEFLLQWPCEIELPDNLDDRALIDEAYQAILLRRPAAIEADQYLRLLQDGIISRAWLIEDLLMSEEFRSLERQLRVIWEGHVIEEPGGLRDEKFPAVSWPCFVED